VFSPFVDSILGRKDEIMASAQVLEELAERVEGARAAIGTEPGFAFGPVTLRAEPVRTPAITDETARRRHEEWRQDQQIRATKGVEEKVKDVGDKVGKVGDMKELTALLKEWLPKIAQSEKDSGALGSAANQWI
jgi:hypothetical protein